MFFFANTIFVSITIASVLLCSGCGGSLLSSSNVFSRGWARPSEHTSQEQEKLYCYKTIGGVDCYKEPLSSEDAPNRKIGTPYDKLLPKPDVYHRHNEVENHASDDLGDGNVAISRSVIKKEKLEPVLIHGR
jgi:hypothetical protein